mmetsp:Transcript_23654/g.82317  ORF Transcript_23654/g.82317 Transcript_23654/m.82317 type:complete len:210 (-) Transcript_23654:652-1281(-)
MTAMMAFWPDGSMSMWTRSTTRVVTSERCGYTDTYSTVSMRSYWFSAIVPMACLPIAHWYVFRGDWLWCGNGMRPATTPRIVSGSISMCVVSGPMLSSRSATRQLFSSFTSTYSTQSSARNELKSRRPASRSARCWPDTLGLRVRRSTMMSGRHTRPESEARCTARWPSCTYTLTYSPSSPTRRSARRRSAKRCGCLCTPMMRPLMKTR